MSLSPEQVRWVAHLARLELSDEELATLTPQQESTRLTTRAQGLRQLAEGTDGSAIIGTNNIAAALRRMTDDLSSYYLLGYYSTGKLDGRFHSITVRVKRRGVSVRARRGYLAATEADANAARSAAAGNTTAAVSPAAVAEARLQRRPRASRASGGARLRAARSTASSPRRRLCV